MQSCKDESARDGCVIDHIHGYLGFLLRSSARLATIVRFSRYVRLSIRTETSTERHFMSSKVNMDRRVLLGTCHCAVRRLVTFLHTYTVQPPSVSVSCPKWGADADTVKLTITNQPGFAHDHEVVCARTQLMSGSYAAPHEHPACIYRHRYYKVRGFIC